MRTSWEQNGCLLSSFKLVFSNGVTFLQENFLWYLYIRSEKMMYKWVSLCESKIVFFSKSFMSVLSNGATFSETFLYDLSINSKKWWKSDLRWIVYTLYDYLDVFQFSFLSVFTNRATFTKELFIWDLYFKRKKWCTIDPLWLIHISWKQNWCILTVFLVVFINGAIIHL